MRARVDYSTCRAAKTNTLADDEGVTIVPGVAKRRLGRYSYVSVRVCRSFWGQGLYHRCENTAKEPENGGEEAMDVQRQGTHRSPGNYLGDTENAEQVKDCEEHGQLVHIYSAILWLAGHTAKSEGSEHHPALSHT